MGVDQLTRARVLLGLIPLDFKNKTIEKAYLKKQVGKIMGSDMCEMVKVEHTLSLLFGEGSEILKDFRNAPDEDSSFEDRFAYVESGECEMVKMVIQYKIACFYKN